MWKISQSLSNHSTTHYHSLSAPELQFHKTIHWIKWWTCLTIVVARVDDTVYIRDIDCFVCRQWHWMFLVFIVPPCNNRPKSKAPVQQDMSEVQRTEHCQEWSPALLCSLCIVRVNLQWKHFTHRIYLHGGQI